jgi:hypothetical protein
LLLLQENISYPHRLRRRNPGVPGAQRRKEQRVKIRRAVENFLWMGKNANVVGPPLRTTNPLLTPISIAILPPYIKIRKLSKTKRILANQSSRRPAAPTPAVSFNRLALLGIII